MPTTILGIALGLFLMVLAIITTANQDPTAHRSVYSLYLDLSAFFIVVGGTIAATLIAHPFSHIIRGMNAFFTLFFRQEFDNLKIVEEICEFANIYAQTGIKGLEGRIKTYKDENMLNDGMKMILDGYQKDEIKKALEINVTRRYDREMIDYYVFRTMGRSAPAFGMVGTLIGLIFMLRSLGDSPEKMGPFIATALVATLYGLILANVIFIPMGNKIEHHAEINLRIGNLQIQGVMYIIEKRHPIFIRDQLSHFMSPLQRKKLYAKENISQSRSSAKA
ncbi:MAG: MotA/TolQ/ExbB proton channel family protein [Elusimicrobiota bacterium]